MGTLSVDFQAIIDVLPLAISWHRPDSSLVDGNSCFHEYGHSKSFKDVPWSESTGYIRISQPAVGMANLLVRGLLEATEDFIFLKDMDGRYLLANQSWANFVGKTTSSIVGCLDFELFDSSLANQLREADQELSKTRQATSHRRWLASGQQRALFHTIRTPLFDKQQNLIAMIGVSRDITEQYRSQVRLERLVMYDINTGLPNRTHFQRRLNSICHSPQDWRTALILLDIDNFRQINSAYSDAIGDKILYEVGMAMQTLLPEDAVVARLGADEFGVIVSLSGECNEATVQKLCGPFEYVLDGHQISVTLSAGMTEVVGEIEPAQLLHEAEQAQAFARAQTVGSLLYYDPIMDQQTKDQRLLLSELQEAISHHRLTLQYQPLVNAAGNELLGAEALVRWYSPTMGQVSPEHFIPLAEQHGLILELGRQVMEMAIIELGSWQRQGLRINMAVNLSPAQLLDDNLEPLIVELAKRHNVDIAYLELEFTEHMLLDSSPMIKKRLEHLASLGLRFAIDDFGTGYCSLSYLKQFVVHKLKIDRSFVSDLCQESSTLAITSAIAKLARDLGITLTAEGVESAAQLQMLQKIGVDQIQGFLFSRPLKNDMFIEWSKDFAERCALTQLHSSCSSSSSALPSGSSKNVPQPS